MARASLEHRLATVALSLCLTSCTGSAVDAEQSHIDRGRELVVAAGCGSCHVIPGIRTARGLVGPPLLSWSDRTYLAGHLPNTIENLTRWLVDPAAINPRTAMPQTGLDEREARDVALFLHTLH